jgi:hypothetical protein
MNESTRRGFLTRAGLWTAAGAAVAAAPSAVASNTAVAAPSEDLTVPAGAQGAMAAYIQDVRKGEVALMIEGREVVVTDKQLVVRLARAFHAAA